MGLTRVSITRPIFILMIIIALVLMGGISFTSLNQELYPTINSPVVSIVTVYSGASPEDVERLVTKPIEDAVSGLSNVDFIQSSSSEGRSVVTVFFLDRANGDLVPVDVERRVSTVRATLPTEATPPTVSKFDFTATPIMFLALSGNRPLEEIFRFADDSIRPRLEAIDGVGQAAITGGLSREIQVRVDPKRLSAYNLTYEQVAASLQRENLSRPGGSIDQGERQINLRLSGQFRSIDDIAKLVIANTTAPVQLRDVAEIVDTTKKATTISRFNGQTSVAFTITKAATSNEVRTVDNVRAEMAKIQKDLPEGLEFKAVFDSSKFTRGSLNGVRTSLLEAIVLTGIVLLLFLHTARVTTIVLFAIPTSLLTTLLWMNIFGFTLNVMSTLALVLVIGVLVDDSIVVIENIVRHLQMGETPIQAALNGRSEIGLAAIAITLVDVVIFLPVGFLGGVTGGFFRQFGLVIVAAVLTSLFISFTLTPMLASRWLSQETLRVPGGPWGWFIRAWERMFTGLEKAYERVLGWSLRWRYIPPILAVLSLVGAIWMVPAGLVKFEFIPQSDNSSFQVSTELPAGASLERTDRLLGRIEQVISQVPEVTAYQSYMGTDFQNVGQRFGTIYVVLEEPSHRKRTVWQVIDAVKAQVEEMDGAIVRVQSSGFGGSSPVAVRVQGQNRGQVEQVAGQVEQIVRNTKGAVAVKNSAASGNPEYRLVVERDRLADYRITADQVASALRTTVDGTVVTKFRPENANEVDIRLIANEASRADVGSVADVPITVFRDGQPIQVRLGQITRVEQVPGPTTISRRNRVPQATISAGLEGTTPLNDVTTPVGRQVEELKSSLPAGITVALGGQAEDQAEAFSSLLFALGLSIVLIYMLLAALYESFILPFATMFALPVALVGAFLGLAITGNTLNLLSLIGFIVLMGLVGKNGILLVDYTNTLRQRGRSRQEALLEAGPTRLRPILMTTAALCFGLLPIAAKLEEGSTLYASIGALIIGGMITSTALSLVVVPTMYTFFDDFQNLVGKIWRWRPFAKRATPALDKAPAPEPAVPAGRH